MRTDRMVASYLGLRKAIGVAGMLLALLVWFGGVLSGEGIQVSISAYYWTWSRDVLFGVLFIAGSLLIAYVGYDRTDNWTATAAGICAYGIALFPVAGEVLRAGYFQFSMALTNVLHYAFSGSFFVLMGFMAFVQFTKGKRRERNIVYRVSGVAIWTSVLLLVTGKIVVPDMMVDINAVFWLEVVMLVSFGVSWILKGLSTREKYEELR